MRRSRSDPDLGREPSSGYGPRRNACRQIDLTQVKGKREQIVIHEVVWRAADATLMRAPWATEHRDSGHLRFLAAGTRLELGEGHPSLTIGRADQNDLVVRQPVVSRLHARIEYRNGRFVLTDLSAEAQDLRRVRRRQHAVCAPGQPGTDRKRHSGPG